MALLARYPKLAVTCCVAIVVGALVFGVDRVAGSSDDFIAEPEPQGENFHFDLDQLEAALTPLDDLIADPAIINTGNRRVTDPSRGINTNCRDRWHATVFSLEQSAQSFDPTTEQFGWTHRRVFLLADEVVPVDLFAGLAATPVGCDLNSIRVVDHIVSTVTVSEFDGFDAVTIVANTSIYDDDLSQARNAEQVVVTVETDYWVRYGNAVIQVNTEGETVTDVPLLLRDALASLETLSG